MKLNEAQIRFLFEKGYIDAKVLDSITEKGWEEYWINNYEFYIELTSISWNRKNDLYTLTIVDIGRWCKTKDIVYSIIFQNDDLNILNNLS